MWRGRQQAGNLKVEFVYDYLGRRVAKRVYTYVGGQWALSRHRKFIWSGWLMLQELDGSLGDMVLRQYTWGLDLAGQVGSVNSLEAAGGIGGLLAVHDT